MEQAGHTAAIVEAMQDLIASAVLRNENIARQMGMNVVDLQALNVLMRATEPMTASGLASRTGLPASTVTRVVDRLESAGLAKREHDSRDRRKIWIVADETRLFRHGDPYAYVKAQFDTINQQFTREELDVVVRYLQTVADSIPATDS
jgi:DNA-binding MarR family transcriptional regulator